MHACAHNIHETERMDGDQLVIVLHSLLSLPSWLENYKDGRVIMIAN